MAVALASLLLCLLVAVHAVKVNIIHTTDIHGWVAGHPHQPTLNADFGDFHSMLLHMKANAAQNGEEFLLFDTGDLIEGTGLSDATVVHGEYIFDVIQNVATYDALTMGNHDIGHPEVIDLIEQGFVPFWNGSYLTANSLLASNKNYIGAPFTLFTTKLGTTVLVMGYLFNFTHNANNTIVVPVSISLTEAYFAKAMSIPNVDLIVVCAHIAPQAPVELTQIYKAIRDAHPTTPLAILSGHSHMEYFQQYDANSFTLESGKYFEVIGHIQFELESGSMKNLTTNWVPTTVDNFVALSGTTADTFATAAGNATKALISKYEQLLGLDIVYGCSPMTYWPDDPFYKSTSLYNLYVEHVAPKVLFNTADGNTQYFLTNTQSLRYALYEGNVTRNDIYTISPFNDTFVYFKGIPGNYLTTLMYAITNTSGLASDRCAPKLRKGVEDAPNWYYSTTPVVSSSTYDLVLASYDAETILPVVQKILPSSMQTYAPYPSDMNGTGALQVYIEQYMSCSNTKKH